MEEKIGLSRKLIGLIAAGSAAVLTLVFVICLSLGGHYISIAKSAHGEIEANKRRANANETVTLTYTAEDGYELMEVFVNGEALEALEFVMPDENVLVEARFAVAGSEKSFNDRHAKDTPGAISYEAVYPTGETHTVSWDFIYEKDHLAASAWIEGENYNGNGVLLNLSREEIGDNLELNYLPNKTYQIFVEYQQNEGEIEPQISLKKADKKGILQDADPKGIEAEINEWNEEGVIVGYQVKLNVSYSLLGYKGKKAAKDSLTLLAGNRAEILPNMMGDFWLEGEHDPENYLTYPRLIDDNTLRENIFLDMTEMELAAYRDMGYALDGIIDENEYKGTMLEDATDAHSIKVWAHLTKGRNIQLVMEVESNTGFDELVNAYPGLSQYLFAEMGFGDNDGQTCTMVKANMTGEVENALSVVTVEENEGNSKYKNKAVVEMWIPQESISQNVNKDVVRFSRFALFSGNMGEGSTPENIFLVARWADINNCNITVDGIRLESEVVPPEDEIKGMDGVIYDGEYPGTLVLEYSDTHRVTVRGFLTHSKNIRLAVRIESHTNPEEVVNEFPGLGKYLFMEAAFGDNNGETDCRYVKANVLGKAEWAASVVKTTDLKNYGEYRYSTDMEMWIPSYAVTNNVDPDNVEITRLGFFSGNVTGNETPDNLFAVARWADINACLITDDGLMYKPQFDVPAEEAEGLDGEIEEDEYEGRTISAASDNYRISLQGYLTKDKNVRLAMVFDSKLHPETLLNKFPRLSKFLFGEMCLGHNTGNPEVQDEDDPLIFIKANVVGQAENCVSAVKYTKNSKDADYRYTTVVEMWIPEFCITNNKTPNEVPITRLGVFHELDKEDKDANWLIAKWAELNYCAVTKDGIKYKSLVEIPEKEASGFDGKISAGEYKGQKLSTESKNYKLSVQAYLTSGKNIRLGIEVESKHDIEKILNKYPGLSQYLFAELGFGHNDGQKTTLVKGNVLGQAENADIEVKTTKTGNSNRPYKTVIELWVPQSCITNNKTPDAVPFTRMALFHELDKEDPETNWLIAKWVNEGAGLNTCTITAAGIIFGDIIEPTETLKGFDGVISKDEYKGRVIEESAENYKATIRGYLTEKKNIRMAIEVETKFDPTDPKSSWNIYPELSSSLFAELAFGDNQGNELTTKLVKANLFGEGENADVVIKTVENKSRSGYSHKTTMEMWIPASAITNNKTPNDVVISRIAFFNENTGKEGEGDNLFAVAKWAGINDCSITANGIKYGDVVEPTETLKGFDGVVSKDEYKGEVVEGVAKNYKATIRGYLTEKKNIRMAIEVETKFDPTDPKSSWNVYQGVSSSLFAELAFGDNQGNEPTTKLVKANLFGEGENADVVVKTVENKSRSGYSHKTTMEMWIPASAITNNKTPNAVAISRIAFFNENTGEPNVGDNLFAVAKWAGINDCTITAKGIVLKTQEDGGETDTDTTVEIPESESDGFDGFITDGEYQGATLESTTENYHTTIQGYLTDEKNIRLVLKVESNLAPETVVNKFGEAISQPFFAEMGFGQNTGNGDCTLVKANVLGKAENAAAIAKTKDNGANAAYRYETVVEVWIPKSSVTNNTNEDEVIISRLALFHDTKEYPNAGIDFVVAKWANINDCRVTTTGIELDSTIKVPEAEKAGLDGIIEENEYPGTIISGKASNYEASVQGYLTSDKDVRLGIKIHSDTHPNNTANAFPGVGAKMFAELCLGNNEGDQGAQNGKDESIVLNMIKANVLGESENAVSAVNTVENADGSTYKYTTTIEMYIPSASITNNTSPEKVSISRLVFFNGNMGEGSTPDNLYLIANWADINECAVTTAGIRTYEQEQLLKDAKVDGVIEDNEYGGDVLVSNAAGQIDDTKYYVEVRGTRLDANKNMKIAVKIDSATDPAQEGDNLYVEMGLGNKNAADFTKLVKAYVSGKAAENASTVVKITQNTGENVTYPYTTVIEMYVPASVIDEESATDGKTICIPRVYLYSPQIGSEPGKIVDRSATGSYGWKWITGEGIKDVGTHDTEGAKEQLLKDAKVDGVIEDNEYSGDVLVSNAAGQIDATKYYVEVRGTRLDANKNMKIAVKIDSATDPAQEGDNLYVEMGLGNRAASQFIKLVKAYVSGKAENASTVVKTTQNTGENVTYPYTTVIEMYVPASVIDEESATDGNTICIPRVYLYSPQIGSDPGKIVDRWDDNAGPYGWKWITGEGIKDVGTHDAEGAKEQLLKDAKVDGVIEDNEYSGDVLVSNAAGQIDATKYYVEVRGIRLDDDKNMKIAVKVDSATDPAQEGDNLYVEMGLGNRAASQFTKLVKAYASDKAAENAITVAKTTQNTGENVTYPYTTVIEMYVPASVIDEESATDGNTICIPRVYLYSPQIGSDPGKIVDRWDDNAGPYGWKWITGEGIKDVGTYEAEGASLVSVASELYESNQQTVSGNGIKAASDEKATDKSNQQTVSGNEI